MSDDEDYFEMDFSNLDPSSAVHGHDIIMGFGLPTESERPLMVRIRQRWEGTSSFYNNIFEIWGFHIFGVINYHY